MRRLPSCFAGLLAALLGCLAPGCSAPALVVRPLYPIGNASPGPAVHVLPFHDQRAEPLRVSTGYTGIFQARQDLTTRPDTPPASVLQAALASELASRGFATTESGQYEVGCQLDQFLLRYRNYAGVYSATDGWGYLDLSCRVTAAGQTVWEGPIYGRNHQVFYVSYQNFADVVWPKLSGALVQQVAAVLNRTVFHRAAAPATVQEGLQRLANKDADRRYLGAYILGVTGDPAMIPLLMPHLADPEKKVRRAVVDALGTLGAVEALPALLARFDSEDGNVQWAIIKDILQLGAPEGFAWLRQKAPAITADTLKEIVSDVLAHAGPPQ